MSTSPVDKALQTQLDNIEKNTGKSLAEWYAIVNKSGLSKHGEMVSFLKEKHGFTHGNANTLIHFAKQSQAGGPEDPDDLVKTQYNGKEQLKTWYDKLIKEIKAFGNDVEVSPKKAYVSVRRKKQFAIIQPSTKTRLDVGLNLKGVEPNGSLEASGSWNAMCTHRVKVEDEKMINKDLVEQIRKAYEQAG